MVDAGAIAVFVFAFIVVFCIGICTGIIMLAAYMDRAIKLSAARQSLRPGDEWKEGKQPNKNDDWLRRVLGNDDNDPETK